MMVNHTELVQATHQQCRELLGLIEESKALWEDIDITPQKRSGILALISRLEPIVDRLIKEELMDEEIEIQAKAMVIKILEQATITVKDALETEES